MAQEASYLVTKDGARGILVSERVGEKLHIKALVASPQKQGIGRLLVETFAAKLPKDTAIYVQADNCGDPNPGSGSPGMEAHSDRREVHRASPRHHLRRSLIIQRRRWYYNDGDGTIFRGDNRPMRGVFCLLRFTSVYGVNNVYRENY